MIKTIMWKQRKVSSKKHWGLQNSEAMVIAYIGDKYQLVALYKMRQ